MHKCDVRMVRLAVGSGAVHRRQQSVRKDSKHKAKET